MTSWVLLRVDKVRQSGFRVREGSSWYFRLALFGFLWVLRWLVLFADDERGLQCLPHTYRFDWLNSALHGCVLHELLVL